MKVKEDSTQMRIVFKFITRFLDLYTKNPPSLPLKKVNSKQWPMFTSARDYVQTGAFFKILHNVVHISINHFIFKHSAAQRCRISWPGRSFCRSKLSSLNSQNGRGNLSFAVLWKVCWTKGIDLSNNMNISNTYVWPIFSCKIIAKINTMCHRYVYKYYYVYAQYPLGIL